MQDLPILVAPGAINGRSICCGATGDSALGYLYFGEKCELQPDSLCFLQVASPWLQDMRIANARMHLIRSMALRDLHNMAVGHSWGGLLMDDGVTPNAETIEKMFEHFDENNDGQLQETELRALIVGMGMQHQVRSARSIACVPCITSAHGMILSWQRLSRHILARVVGSDAFLSQVW